VGIMRVVRSLYKSDAPDHPVYARKLAEGLITDSVEAPITFVMNPDVPADRRKGFSWEIDAASARARQSTQDAEDIASIGRMLGKTFTNAAEAHQALKDFGKTPSHNSGNGVDMPRSTLQ
jgi:hypothetical protein